MTTFCDAIIKEGDRRGSQPPFGKGGPGGIITSEVSLNRAGEISPRSRCQFREVIFSRTLIRFITVNNRGFTLIEALVALGILTIGVLTVYTMQTGSVRGNLRARQISTASAWAMDKMEQFNALAYDDSLLADERQDSTSQDGDNNGIDDDDEGRAGGDGITNFGLDQRTAATADHTFTDLNGHTMYCNIAVNQPLEQMKTIRIIVVRNSDQQPLIFDYYKAAPL